MPIDLSMYGADDGVVKLKDVPEGVDFVDAHHGVWVKLNGKVEQCGESDDEPTYTLEPDDLVMVADSAGEYLIERLEPSGQDQVFFDKAIALNGNASRAREEAEQYANGIQHPGLKAEALRRLDL